MSVCPAVCFVQGAQTLTLDGQREEVKAAHYIQLLDNARCEGNWEAVPELVRKVRKHAPQRTCTYTPGKTAKMTIANSDHLRQ